MTDSAPVTPRTDACIECNRPMAVHCQNCGECHPIEREADAPAATEALPVAEQGPCNTDCCDLQTVSHIHNGNDPLEEWLDRMDATREAPEPTPAPEHDINCGIDALRLGEDIGCTCHVRFEDRPTPATGLSAEALAEAIHDGMNTIGCMGAFHNCINRSQHEQSAKIALARLSSTDSSEDSQ